MYKILTVTLLLITLIIITAAFYVLRNLQKHIKQNEAQHISGLDVVSRLMLGSFAILWIVGLFFGTGTTPIGLADKVSSMMSGQMSDKEIAAAKIIFDESCSACHGDHGEGNIGPNFTDEYFIHGTTKEEITKVITEGVVAKGMAAWGNLLSEEEVELMATYILTLPTTTPENPKPPQGEKYAFESGKWKHLPGEAITANIITLPKDLAEIPLGGDVEKGKRLFNGVLGCAHCHGSSGHGHVDNRDVKGIQKRYGDDYLKMIDYVMLKGRKGTAMPPWDHLNEQKLSDLKTFMASIQQI